MVSRSDELDYTIETSTVKNIGVDLIYLACININVTIN